MTNPTMEQVSQTVKAIQDNADDLGLVWNLLTATVAGSTSPAATTIVMDGPDNTQIPAISMIGAISAGRRVFVIQTPKGGLYIVGFGGPETHGELRGETGTATVSFTTLSSTAVAVTFARAFKVAPVVFANIRSPSGTTTQWTARASAVTTTGFTLALYNVTGATSTWASVPVDWSAVVNP